MSSRRISAPRRLRPPTCDGGRRSARSRYLPPAAPCCIFSTTLLMLKLPAFWLGGNSLNVARNSPTMSLRRHEDKRVADHPVVIGVRRDVGPFVGVHPQIEDLGQPQFSERFGPNRHRARGALFGEDKLPVVVAQAKQVALVAEVEELLARIFRGLAGQVRQQVVAVEMHLEGLVADFHALEELLFHVGNARSREERGHPVEVRHDAVVDRAGLDVAGPAASSRARGRRLPSWSSSRCGTASCPRPARSSCAGRCRWNT